RRGALGAARPARWTHLWHEHPRGYADRTLTMAITRRTFLSTSLAVAAGGRSWAAAWQAATPPLRLLVIGGTGFLGPHVVERALARGHSLTLFNRGRTNPTLFAGKVEQLRGDRKTDVSALERGTWDAV